MKTRLFLTLFLTFPFLTLSAETLMYGKLWITVESQHTSDGNEVEVVSNKSRIGFKGNINFIKGFEAIYQAEYEIDPVDGTADESKNKSVKQRNSFIGLRGAYGTLFIGKHDTALKLSQAKIDLFNDLAGDIKNIFHGENRLNNFIGYTTPTLGKAMSATFNVIKETEGLESNDPGSSTSIAINYKTKNIYMSLDADSMIKGLDSRRISFHIPLDRMEVGFIYQENDNLRTSKREGGYVTSFSRNIGAKGVFKIQTALSSMKIGSGEQTSFGYDYTLSNKSKVFFFYTDFSGDREPEDKKITALGFEYKF